MPARNGSNSKPRARLTVECLEDRTTPAFLSPSAPGTINVNGVNVPTGGLSIAAGPLFPMPDGSGLIDNNYVTGTGPGVEALVRVWSRDGTLLRSFDPFPGFKGGVNVAVGTVFGGTHFDIIVGVAQDGPPHVKVFDPNGTPLTSFYAFAPGYMGGVNLACGNVLGGILAGGYTGGQYSSQFPSEIVIGAATNSSHVVVTDGDGNYLRSFLAFDPGFHGGVTVATANVDSQRAANFVFGQGLSDTNAYDEVIVGAASSIPHVKVFDVWQGGVIERESFYAFDPKSGHGVTLAAGDTDGSHGAEIYASLIGTSTVRIFDGETGQLGFQFDVYPPTYSHVINMVVAWLTPPDLGGPYDPSDDDTVGGNSFDFDTKDLAVVAGDGPLQQEPRYFIGLTGAPAGENGPTP
jgi:hypothetical protein